MNPLKNQFSSKELAWTNWLLQYNENEQDVTFPRFYNSMYALNMTDEETGLSHVKVQMGDQKTENTCICQSYDLESKLQPTNFVTSTSFQKFIKTVHPRHHRGHIP